VKILITAGPTWIKVDEIRILTSIFTGRTGIYLAKRFKDKGHSVTLLLNSYFLESNIRKKIRVIPFKYYEDFKRILISELKRNRYSSIIHSAAVSDYKLKKPFEGKIPSGKKEINLKFIPTEKIVKKIRSLAKKSLLIQFKLEMERKYLLKRAYRSLMDNRSDYVVANAYEDLQSGYRGYLIDRYKQVTTLNNKKDIFICLYKIIGPP
jgi:phosphopantothenoylcysteine decarboxylase/phosphopantothenate--cysteine ligase